LEHSENVENLRAKGRVHRVSIERLCAGPALPLIYDFIAGKYPELKRTLETEQKKTFEEISPTMVGLLSSLKFHCKFKKRGC